MNKDLASQIPAPRKLWNYDTTTAREVQLANRRARRAQEMVKTIFGATLYGKLTGTSAKQVLEAACASEESIRPLMDAESALAHLGL